jgi:hypothetical protein
LEELAKMNEPAVKFKGVKEMVAILQTIEPEMYKQFRKDIRKLAAPAVSSIKSNVPPVSPFLGGKDGFTHSGRTAWSAPRVTVSITPNQRSRALGSTTANLVAIVTRGSTGQGLVIADMAGRGGSQTRNSVTRPYAYKGGTRTHRVNGQGQAMIRALEKRPSRFVYPAIERQLPAIRVAVADSIEQMAKNVNIKISRVN